MTSLKQAHENYRRFEDSWGRSVFECYQNIDSWWPLFGFGSGQPLSHFLTFIESWCAHLIVPGVDDVLV